jgi:ABC-type bacteriocin/lantibiotic exporter with double-glycine peptidase domain
MDIQDTLALLHPAIAIIIVFPLIGIVVNRAWLTLQRRLQTKEGQKSKISPVVGSEHVAIGNWLSGSVVGVALLGMAYPIFSKFISNDVVTKEPFRVFFIIAMFLLSIASFVLLFKAKVKLWRGIFATLTGMGLIILGFQP